LIASLTGGIANRYLGVWHLQAFIHTGKQTNNQYVLSLFQLLKMHNLQETQVSFYNIPAKAFFYAN
jgi:hypothetical protein